MNFATKRFFAGETVDDAIALGEKLNAEGFECMFNYVGEHSQAPETRDHSVAVYKTLIEKIGEKKLHAGISIKLSQFGFFGGIVHREKTLTVFSGLLTEAKKNGVRVWIDGEELEHEEKTNEFIKRFFEIMPVGKILQAYNKRVGCSAKNCTRPGAFFRVCKGAYQEKPELIYLCESDIKTTFVDLIQSLLKGGNYVQAATHDKKLIERILVNSIPSYSTKDLFEIGMLLGVNMKLAFWLLDCGLPVNMYVPFGTVANKEGYGIRRIIEKPKYIFLPVLSVLRAFR